MQKKLQKQQSQKSNMYWLIKKYEGFSSKPYLCPAGVATIGYGTTRYPDGTKVSMVDEPITEEQATAYLNSYVINTILSQLKSSATE